MGLILDLIGGMASAGGEMMGEQRKSDMLAERERAQAADTEQRQMRVEKFRSDLDEKKQRTIEANKIAYEKRRQTELADQGDKIVSQGEEIGKKREVKSMTLGAAGLPFQGEFSGQEIKSSDIESMPPAARKIYEEQGFLPKRTGSGLIADQMTAARSMGADPTLRKDLQSQYGTTLADERKVDADALATRKADDKVVSDERKATETERNNRSDREAADKRTAAILQSVSIRADASASKADRAQATLNLNTTVDKQGDIIENLNKELFAARKGTPEAAKIQAKLDIANEIFDLAQKGLKGALQAGDYKEPKPTGGKPAASAAPPPVSMLKEGSVTKFKNGGGSWTLRGGKAVQVN